MKFLNICVSFETFQIRIYKLVSRESNIQEPIMSPWDLVSQMKQHVFERCLSLPKTIQGCFCIAFGLNFLFFSGFLYMTHQFGYLILVFWAICYTDILCIYKIFWKYFLMKMLFIKYYVVIRYFESIFILIYYIWP